MDSVLSSQAQRDKWNRIYQNKLKLSSSEPQSQQKAKPCTLLSEYRYLLPTSGLALDLACGSAGNAFLLTDQGLTTHAWDISDVIIEQIRAQNIALLNPNVLDVENSTLPKNTFAVIVVANYLHRPSCQAISHALVPGGLLFYQTFHRQKLTNTGPSDPNFLLKNNELLSLFSELDPLIHIQLGHQGDLTKGNRDQACLIAQKPI